MYKHLISTIIVLLFLGQDLFPSVNQVMELAHRVIPQFASQFVFKEQPAKGENDFFEIESKNGKIIITGNNAVSLSRGLNHYLNEICKVSVSWNSDNLADLSGLPEVDKKIYVESLYRYRYYLNYCTYDYTMMGWDWNRWEKEIDWMALHGVNLVLASVYDQYAVWQNTLKRLGFTEQEIFSFLPGLGYEAWWLMSNLEGFGGPVSQEFINERVELQRKILDRMRELDIAPIYQGFYGMVPNSLLSKYPDCRILSQGLWGVHQRPAMMDPEDACFKEIASIYYEEQEKLFGKAGFYGGDPFHEGGNLEGINVKKAAAGIYASINEHAPGSKWILQGWWENPRRELLEGVTPGSIIVLDLMACETPQWGGEETTSKRYRPEGYLEHQWIWCALPNFGGRVGMHGKMSSYISGAINAKNHPKGKHICGIGIAPEGIGTNPVVYDMIFDMAWSNRKNSVDEWIEHYVQHRYHSDNKNLKSAWKLLAHSIFECNNQIGGPIESAIRVCPADKIEKVSGWGAAEQFYNPNDILESWELFFKEKSLLETSATFREDFTDVSRQVLADYSRILHVSVMDAFEKKDISAFDEYSNKFLDLILDVDSLLSTRKELNVGNWLQAVKAQATSKNEENLFLHNAKMLITTWGDSNSGLRDYANKEWAGLLRDYYYPRWKAYFQYKKDLLNGINRPEPDYFAMELTWVNNMKDYPAETTGDVSVIIEKLFNKYYHEIKNCYQ